MFKPFLLDGGFTKEEISRWTGVYGMVASTLGSMRGSANRPSTFEGSSRSSSAAPMQ